MVQTDIVVMNWSSKNMFIYQHIKETVSIINSLYSFWSFFFTGALSNQNSLYVIKQWTWTKKTSDGIWQGQMEKENLVRQQRKSIN